MPYSVAFEQEALSLAQRRAAPPRPCQQGRSAAPRPWVLHWGNAVLRLCVFLKVRHKPNIVAAAESAMCASEHWRPS